MLLWAVLGIVLLPLLLPAEWLPYLMLWPFGELQAGGSVYGFMPWQPLTHVLVGQGLGHIIFMGLTLVFFGARLEAIWGTPRYGTFLLTVTLGSGVVQALLLTLANAAGLVPFLPVAGASATLFGILFAAAYLNPRDRVMLLIPPVPMQMRTLVIALCAIELAIGVFGSPNGLAHLGFLVGMAIAWLHIRYWRGQPPFKPRGPRRVH